MSASCSVVKVDGRRERRRQSDIFSTQKRRTALLQNLDAAFLRSLKMIYGGLVNMISDVRSVIKGSRSYQG